jgi:hypothetical protein
MRAWFKIVRFKGFTAVTMKNGVFWDVTPCGVRRLLVTASVVPGSPILVTLIRGGGARFLRNVGSYKSHAA